MKIFIILMVLLIPLVSYADRCEVTQKDGALSEWSNCKEEGNQYCTSLYGGKFCVSKDDIKLIEKIDYQGNKINIFESKVTQEDKIRYENEKKSTLKRMRKEQRFQNILIDVKAGVHDDNSKVINEKRRERSANIEKIKQIKKEQKKEKLDKLREKPIRGLDDFKEREAKEQEIKRDAELDELYEGAGMTAERELQKRNQESEERIKEREERIERAERKASHAESEARDAERRAERAEHEAEQAERNQIDREHREKFDNIIKNFK